MSTARAGESRGRLGRALLQVGFFGGLVLLWHGLHAARIWDPVLFPSPLQVAQSFWTGFANGSYPAAAAASLQRLLLGYALSVTGGVPLGLLLGRVRWADATIGSLALGLQAIPSICWLPLAILWFGLGEEGMLFVVVMGSLMALTLSVRDGVRAIPPLYLRAARMLGAGARQAYLHVVLPASLPAVVTGAKMGWSFAWRSLMAAELLYVDTGLGALLTTGRELHDMPQVVAVMGVIMLLGLLADRLVFGYLERKIQERWGHEPQGSGWGL
ncbi:MAG: ABC transporter permease [Acidobacteria bacterium]|nr:ABC transporter permease [Acidobacteriota bacterium]